MDWTNIIIAAITGLLTGGLGVAIVTAISNRAKTKAEAEAILQDTKADSHDRMDERAQELIDRVWKRMDRLDARIEAQETECENLKAELKVKDLMVAKLQAQVQQLEEENEELRRQRDQQIETNRRQGQKIAKLTKALEESNSRIRQLEERLGDSG